MSDNGKQIIYKPQPGFQERFVRSNVDVVIGGGAMGCQPLYSLVMTPGGEVPIGEIEVGDVVCGRYMEPRTVTDTRFYTEQNIYDVYTEDGRKTSCSDLHWWEIIHEDGLKEVVPMYELRHFIESGEKIYIPVVSKCKEEYNTVRIESCRRTGRDIVKSITIDGDERLYVTDNGIVTHNCGKSFAALLMFAEPSRDSNFRAVCLRKTISETKSGGGMVDDASMIYSDVATMKISDSPRLTFDTGSFVDFTHVADQNEEKLLERVKGWQYDCVYFDEGTGYEWSTFKTILSRNRGKGKWTGKVRMTTNPKKTHWLRTFLDWWILPSGYPDPDKDGVVRYFFLRGRDVKDVVWGSSKEEVYSKCQYQIDELLAKQNKHATVFTYKDFIKSATFYAGVLSENKALLQNSPGYVGSVSAMGEKERLANVQGNWNVDPEPDSDSQLSYSIAESVFFNDPQVNGDKWITADLAEKGSDNFVAFVWDGLHIYDYCILQRSSPRMNAIALAELAKKHEIPGNRIIFDGIHGMYIKDYIPEAEPFISNKAAIGIFRFGFTQLKDECYARLVNLIKNGGISFSDSVANAKYEHQKLNNFVSIRTEFIEECEVVRFKNMPNGKRKLYSKKEMNAMLGKDRSMDVLDPIAMRMYPLAEYAYGEELEKTSVLYSDYEPSLDEFSGTNIYDETLWN